MSAEHDRWLSEARSGEGTHRIILDYARHRLADIITADDLDEAEDIRRDRALAEYGDFATGQIDADHVRAAAAVAEHIVSAVALTLAKKAERFPPDVPDMR